MTLKKAKQVTGHKSGLGKPSKMPGFSTSLPAEDCKNGRKLAEASIAKIQAWIDGGKVGKKPQESVCSRCYAMGGNYLYPSVKSGLKNRLRALAIGSAGAIENSQWVEGMVRLIGHYTDPSDPYFRVHDSGDIQSVDHLLAWALIAKMLPWVRFWLPTKEYLFYKKAKAKLGGSFPDNLVIRLSAPMNGASPPKTFRRWGALSSTVQASTGFACEAYTRKNKCGPCRACWDPNIKNIDYHIQ